MTANQSGDHATFAEWDASYVLGALTPQDRRDYEAHLEQCDTCRAAIAELAPMPGLLARARPIMDLSLNADAVAGPPADLLSLVQQRDKRRRRTVRQRVLMGTAAVAASIALGVAIPLALMRPAPPAATLALAPVTATALTASVDLTPASWGTSIIMDCEYAVGGAPYDGSGTYVLVVTDQDGNTSQVSTWTAGPGDSVQLVGATALTVDQIASVEVQSASGDVLLSSPLPA
jgi:hypothetical protein